jgi:hypothetical protein
MIFGEKFISAKVESAKIVFGEKNFQRKWKLPFLLQPDFDLWLLLLIQSGLNENKWLLVFSFDRSIKQGRMRTTLTRYLCDN